jgi:hypothetical protein
VSVFQANNVSSSYSNSDTAIEIIRTLHCCCIFHSIISYQAVSKMSQYCYLSVTCTLTSIMIAAVVVFQGVGVTYEGVRGSKQSRLCACMSSMYAGTGFLLSRPLFSPRLPPSRPSPGCVIFAQHTSTGNAINNARQKHTNRRP